MADAQGNRYGPYDTDVNPEAEPFLETAWHDAFDFLTGVVSGADLTFAGLTATLSATPSTPLHIWSHGGYLIRTDPYSVASPATAAGANPRRDMIVARRQLTAGATPGKTFLQLLQGAPAASPADPTYNADTDEPLWSWQVPGNGGTVVTGVRDFRRPVNSTPRLIPTMADRPTTNRILGTRVRPMDRAWMAYTWDGTHWVPDGWPLTADRGGAPVGAYLRMEGGTALVTTNAAGAYSIPISPAMSAPPFMAVQTVGDTSGAVRPTPANYVPTGITGLTTASSTLRVNWTAYGYNT